MPSDPPHYSSLGLRPSASASELAKQYKKLSLLLHPDRAAYRNDPANESAVQQRFQRITEAYDVLSDPQQRAAYDTRHGVNFHGRVSVLQDALQTTPAASADGCLKEPLSPTRVQKRSRAEHSPLCDSPLVPAARVESPIISPAVTEEDEDYTPDTPAHSGLEGSLSCTRGDSQNLRDAGSPRTLPCAFSLYPRHVTWSHDNAYGARQTTLRQVTLHPRSVAHEEDSAVSHEGDRVYHRWGITVRGTVLVHASVAGAPFPAVLTIINGVAVDCADDVRRALALPSLQHQQANSSADVDDTLLDLTLYFATEAFDLVGNLQLLRDPGVLDALLPPVEPPAGHSLAEDAEHPLLGVAPELPTLRPRAAVTSVNGVSVADAATLQARLRVLAADGSTDDSPGNATSSGDHGLARASQRPQTVWIEFATLDGVA